MPERTLPPKPPKAPESGGKAARLAAALRANLARRKAQARARKTPDGEGAGQDSEQQG